MWFCCGAPCFTLSVLYYISCHLLMSKGLGIDWLTPCVGKDTIDLFCVWWLFYGLIFLSVHFLKHCYNNLALQRLWVVWLRRQGHGRRWKMSVCKDGIPCYSCQFFTSATKNTILGGDDVFVFVLVTNFCCCVVKSAASASFLLIVNDDWALVGSARTLRFCDTWIDWFL